MKKLLNQDKLCLHMRLLQPSRPVLGTSFNENKTINVAPFSWVTPISSEPPIIGLALLARPKEQKSLENILTTGDHDLIIARVESATYDTGKFDENLLRNLKNGAPCLHFTQYRQGEGQVHVFAGRVEAFQKYLLTTRNGNQKDRGEKIAIY